LGFDIPDCVKEMIVANQLEQVGEIVEEESEKEAI
jgi:hypothetical protein